MTNMKENIIIYTYRKNALKYHKYSNYKEKRSAKTISITNNGEMSRAILGQYEDLHISSA